MEKSNQKYLLSFSQYMTRLDSVSICCPDMTMPIIIITFRAFIKSTTNSRQTITACD